MPFDSAPSEFALAAKPLALNVRMPDGGWLAPPAEAGVRVMDLLARFGIPLRNDCAGRCVCATCRARLSPAWAMRLRPPGRDEHDALGRLAAADADTRLPCDIVMTPELDGLEIELTWDALVPQTYWVAG